MTTERDPLVLIVEDDPDVRNSVVECLKDIGIRTTTAGDGAAGIDAFHDHRPDVVLLDLRLPQVDGLGVLKAIRMTDADATVIVISGKGMMEDAVASLRLGAFDYLAKPIQDLAVLEHAVCRGIERSRLVRENREYRENLERQVAERTAELQEAYRALEGKNVALQEVLSSIEAERKRFGRQVSQNVERVILPGLRTLKAGLPRAQQRGGG